MRYVYIVLLLAGLAGIGFVGSIDPVYACNPHIQRC